MCSPYLYAVTKAWKSRKVQMQCRTTGVWKTEDNCCVWHVYRPPKATQKQWSVGNVNEDWGILFWQWFWGGKELKEGNKTPSGKFSSTQYHVNLNSHLTVFELKIKLSKKSHEICVHVSSWQYSSCICCQWREDKYRFSWDMNRQHAQDGPGRFSCVAPACTGSMPGCKRRHSTRQSTWHPAPNVGH